MKTSYILHPTSNIEFFAARRSNIIGCWLFDVGCWMFALLFFTTTTSLSAAEKPIRALMVTGGCCHEYEKQKVTLSEGISARANVVWTIIHEGDSDAKDTKFSIYGKPDWIKDFDVVVHNECSGRLHDEEWVKNIVKAHVTSGVPAVMIHCAIHSYRESETDEWRKLLGVSSMRHQAKRSFQVVNVQPNHPIMKTFPAKWTDPEDELYEIIKLWPDATPLAKSITPKKPDDQHPSIWINNYGKAKVFGTTLGHLDDVMKTDVYLDTITRGLLWACDKLDDKGDPKAGYGPAKSQAANTK